VLERAETARLYLWCARASEIVKKKPGSKHSIFGGHLLFIYSY